jgi:type IV pilus assembly protein PilN
LDGKQIVYSSRTQNLDEAIPILEKWYDEVTSVSKIDDENNNVNNELLTNNLKNNDQPHTQKIESQLQNDELEISENKDLKSKMFDNLRNIQLKNIFKSKNSEN